MITLQNVIDFALLSRYDGKLKNWVKLLVPTADVLYTAEDEEVIAGTKQVGDVKVAGHGGLISKTLFDKLSNMPAFSAIKLNLGSGAETVAPDGNGNITIDVSGKADKVSGGTENNFAALDASGNMKDSGKKATDFATDTQGGYADSALQSVSANGSGFVSASFASKAGENGAKSQVLTVGLTTKAVADATAESDGLATAKDVKDYVGAVVSNGINFLGSVDKYSELPANPSYGDMYNVVNDETISGTLYNGDMNYVYAAPVLYKETDEEVIGGTKEAGDVKVAAHWDPQAPLVRIETASNAQIDSLF